MSKSKVKFDKGRVEGVSVYEIVCTVFLILFCIGKKEIVNEYSIP